MVKVKCTGSICFSLLIACFLVCASDGFSQKIVKIEKVTDHSTYIVGDRFEGVVFDKTYGDGTTTSRVLNFTPSEIDVIAAEKILTAELNAERKENTHKYHAFIKTNLRKYIRQYFGYVNDKNERIIYINCFWREGAVYLDNGPLGRASKVPEWKTSRIVVKDGGKGYWQIKINITTHKSFEFWVNGEG